MNNIFNRISLMALAAATVMSVNTGCTKDFEEINTNPNNMSEGMATPYNMLEYLLYEPAQWNDHYSMMWNGELVQYHTYTTTAARQIHIYKLTDSEFSTAWNNYGRFALNARHMYHLAERTKDNACKAIAMTLEVMQIANQVSLFGDIPYSEAFGLREGTNNSQPKFDTQKEVFEQMIAKLDSANQIYRGKEGAHTFQYPGLDGMYGGDMKKWQKFNNSLKLRLLCRVSGRPEMNVDKQIQAMVNDNAKWPIFSSNDDNATVTYTGIAPYVNYYYDKNVVYTSLNDHRLTRHMRKMLVVIDDFGDDMYADPRTSVMFRMNNTSYNENGNWLGAISGGTPDVTCAQGYGTAYFNYDLYLTPTNPTTFMDYAEV
ncbi:MAG: SusD/RagB family nutrient-binding outer membrane lipoprotein, partial [Muribaculaceae bacterium]|nr:SusD/RagB family nutrient-binding outer membrane lipoprotein [Muribaculaceae bacterium]